ncbi:MAG: hypothetical protein CL910_18065 [Deltaproteobacteria bacterium]|nr:hypothetical protein [Deltaproteobacteria bacterium]
MRWTLCAAGLLAALVPGCAGPTSAPPRDFEVRRAQAEEGLAEAGLAQDPAVAASRAELEAAMAREEGEVAIDGVELRTGISERGGDTRVDVRARVPLDRLFELPSRQEARRAEAEAALAKLRSVTLEMSAARCLPALDQRLYQEHAKIFESYVARLETLLQWSRELFEAGVVDEIAAHRLEIASQVKLSSRSPRPVVPSHGTVDAPGVLPEIPSASAPRAALDRDEGLIRSLVARHQPALAVHRALADRYRALAQRATRRRLPSLGFVDVVGEPVARSGQSHAIGAQLSVHLPFGARADAEERRYRALARGEESRGRYLVEDRLRLTEVALLDIHGFEESTGTWHQLLELADRSEEVADRWQRERLAEPSRISALLDDVYDARIAVLEGRERAGLAACGLLAATGVPVAEWPRR